MMQPNGLGDPCGSPQPGSICFREIFQFFWEETGEQMQLDASLLGAGAALSWLEQGQNWGAEEQG